MLMLLGKQVVLSGLPSFSIRTNFRWTVFLGPQSSNEVAIIDSVTGSTVYYSFYHKPKYKSVTGIIPAYSVVTMLPGD
jgi:hypothetical protein